MVSLNIELVQALMQEREREAARRRQQLMASRRIRARRKRRLRLAWFPNRRRYRPAITPPACACEG